MCEKIKRLNDYSISTFQAAQFYITARKEKIITFKRTTNNMADSLLKELIEIFTDEGDIIIDTCACSGLGHSIFY